MSTTAIKQLKRRIKQICMIATNIHELFIHARSRACRGAGGLTAGSLDRRQRAVIGQGRLRALMNI